VQIHDHHRAGFEPAVYFRSLRATAGILNVQTQLTTISDGSAQGSAATPVFFGREYSLALRIADTTVAMQAESGIKLSLSPELADFAIAPERCDVGIRVRWTSKMDAPRGKALFDSGGLWSVLEEKDGRRFVFSSAKLGPKPYKLAWFDGEFRRGVVALHRRYLDAESAMYPLEYPLDELLMIHRLARGEGVEIHGLGVVDGAGRGRLFVGHSGAGKSTLARLWQRESRALVLSDDRIILRERGGRIWMHGTPWHGDAGIASPKAAPLCGAYLIEHGTRPELKPLPKGRAAAEFLARSFVPHYSAEAMDFTLGFLARVARDTPCFTFRFFPDQGAVEAILRAHD
jgi:hypothetical protein